MGCVKVGAASPGAVYYKSFGLPLVASFVHQCDSLLIREATFLHAMWSTFVYAVHLYFVVVSHTLSVIVTHTDVKRFLTIIQSCSLPPSLLDHP